MSRHARKELPLPDAALRLGVSWGVAWRLLLRGALVGRKRGRLWLVDEESVIRLRRSRISEDRDS